MRPELSYLICATPRSGSTLLCEAMQNSGIAGCPEEYFEDLVKTGHPHRPLEYFEGVDDPILREHLGANSLLNEQMGWMARLDSTTYPEFLERVLSAGTTPNGVFGAKVMWGYFGDFITNLRQIPDYRERPVAELLAAIFPNLHYIRVVRQDKVRQAISLWKALQTWTWAHTSSEEAGKSTSHKLLFHYAAIEHLIRQINEHEAAWQGYFASIGVEPYTVIYEQFVERYEQTIYEILEYLHIALPEGLRFAERRMQRQSDQLSEEWVALYHQHKQATL